MAKVSYAPNVSLGIQTLNDHFGNEEWKSKIDLNDLDLKDTEYCVLGQVFGNFYDGLNAIQNNSFWYTDRYSHGFAVTLDYGDMSDWKRENKKWDNLTEEWRKQLSPQKDPWYKSLVKALARG